jgi:Rrf2 family protein
MLRFSKTVDYMVRCVLFLARAKPGQQVSRQAIVAGTDIPDLFFRKIVQELSRAGVLRVTRGPKGGYMLAVPPEKLTLLQIVEIGTGEICLNECVQRPETCGRSGTCSVHAVWQNVRVKFRESLAAVTFADLADPNAVSGSKTQSKQE